MISQKPSLIILRSIKIPERDLQRETGWGWVTCHTQDVFLLGPHLPLGSCTFTSVDSKEQFVFEGIFRGNGHLRVWLIYVLLTEVSHCSCLQEYQECDGGFHLCLLWELQFCLTCRSSCFRGISFPLLCELSMHFLCLCEGRWISAGVTVLASRAALTAEEKHIAEPCQWVCDQPLCIWKLLVIIPFCQPVREDTVGTVWVVLLLFFCVFKDCIFKKFHWSSVMEQKIGLGEWPWHCFYNFLSGELLALGFV